LEDGYAVHGFNPRMRMCDAQVVTSIGTFFLYPTELFLIQTGEQCPQIFTTEITHAILTKKGENKIGLRDEAPPAQSFS
jgi:hypothetical protein